jgi:hypothetical protein
MIGPVVPTAVQVIEAQREPLVLHITTQGISTGGFGGFIVEYDTKSTPNTIYVGKAPSGTSQNAPGWIIIRTTFTALGVQLTEATAMGIYANRTLLSYTETRTI